MEMPRRAVGSLGRAGKRRGRPKPIPNPVDPAFPGKIQRNPKGKSSLFKCHEGMENSRLRRQKDPGGKVEGLEFP